MILPGDLFVYWNSERTYQEVTLVLATRTREPHRGPPLWVTLVLAAGTDEPHRGPPLWTTGLWLRNERVMQNIIVRSSKVSVRASPASRDPAPRAAPAEKALPWAP